MDEAVQRLLVAAAVILKLLADRPQDRLDVSAILRAQGSRLDRSLIRSECSALDIDVPHELGP